MRLNKRQVRLTVFFGLLALFSALVASWPYLSARARFHNSFEYLGVNEQGFREYRHNQSGIVMILVPSGSYWVGTSEKQSETVLDGVEDREESLYLEERRRLIVERFLIAKWEVTQAEWERVTGKTPTLDYLRPPVGFDLDPILQDELPARHVSWTDCKEFCDRTALDIPTEVHWEIACRAGTDGMFGGTGRIEDMGWYGGNSDQRDHKVGAKRANGFGIHDMHGNVAEWCADAADEGGSHSSNLRAIRGGGFLDSSWRCRSSFRAFLPVDLKTMEIGFRPAYYDVP